MQDLLLELSSAAPWLPALGIHACLVGLVVSWGRPLGPIRWPLAIVALCAPLTFPRPTEPGGLVPWAPAATILTSVMIIFAARLPDWDLAARSRRVTRVDLLIWLTAPNARLRRHALPRAWPMAGRYFGKGLAKYLVWELLAFCLHFTDLESAAWPLRSGVLMLFFVLNLTAFHDAVAGFVVLAGYQVDELFDAPLSSQSPRDFWSRRWNKFINRFALKHVALKARRLPPVLVMLLVFACSGLFHEYFAWGVGGREAIHGSMMAFFVIQGGMVWLGTKWSLPTTPPWWPPLHNALTFGWMALTAPLFFRAVEPALRAFGYPAGWLPYPAGWLPF